MNKHTYFISDLHLSADRADISACFERFMQNEAIHADALYILGDLFEVWIGDDDKSPFNTHIANIISTLSRRIPVFFIHGNRDFAIGKDFARQAGMQLLPEQEIITLYGRRILISHGDELCTRDKEYMKFRAKARGWWWPKLMLALPLSWRKRIADKGRNVSKGNKQRLAQDIMDVTKGDVDKTMNHYKVNYFIHGHTHRPNIHQFVLDDSIATRIVLGDWYTQGSVLYADKDGFCLQSRQF